MAKSLRGSNWNLHNSQEFMHASRPQLRGVISRKPTNAISEWVLWRPLVLLLPQARHTFRLANRHKINFRAWNENGFRSLLVNLTRSKNLCGARNPKECPRKHHECCCFKDRLWQPSNIKTPYRRGLKPFLIAMSSSWALAEMPHSKLVIYAK